jgi:hypothetical protein
MDKSIGEKKSLIPAKPPRNQDDEENKKSNKLAEQLIPLVQ